MINGRMPVYLTALGLAALGFGALVWQPYSADFPELSTPSRFAGTSTPPLTRIQPRWCDYQPLRQP